MISPLAQFGERDITLGMSKPPRLSVLTRWEPDKLAALDAWREKNGALGRNDAIMLACERLIEPTAVSLKPGQFGIVHAPLDPVEAVGQRLAPIRGAKTVVMSNPDNGRRLVGYDARTHEPIYRGDAKEAPPRESGKPRAASSPTCPICGSRHPVGADHTWGKK